MRRLPVFFVLDCSESMAGENLKKMEDGIGLIVRSLRQDPHALETVYLSVIAFAGTARTIAPLVDVISFYPPKLPIGSGTSLGAALHELMFQIDHAVVKSSPEMKGDWKPIVYLFTDGKPTDKMNAVLKAWQEQYARKATLIAVAMGSYADVALLQQLTEHVLIYEGSTELEFRKFIAWVTASVSSQSKSIGEGSGGDGVNIAKPDSNVITLVKKGDQPPPPPADNDCVVMVGRCQKKKLPYLIKYDRMKHIRALREDIRATHFELCGCYPVTEEYFEWSSPEAANLTVNTADLVGTPGCPYCGAVTAFAMCGCGKLMCVNGPGVATCPWCKTQVMFGSSNEGSGDFDVQRGRG